MFAVTGSAVPPSARMPRLAPVTSTVFPSSFPMALLLDYVVGPLQQGCRDRDPELLGRLEADRQLEFRGLLDGKVRGLGALEELVHVGGRASIRIGDARPIAHQATAFEVRAVREHRRNAALRRRSGDL